jgi:hypothetical protein
MPRQPKTTRLTVDMSMPTELLVTQRSEQPVPMEGTASHRSQLPALIEFCWRWWIRPGPTSAPGKERLKRRMAELGDAYPADLPHKWWISEFGARERSYYRAYDEHTKAR